MKDIIQTFADFYGEEYVDGQYHSETVTEIIIRFPEITITNSYGDTHKKKEIYVSLKVSIDPPIGVEPSKVRLCCMLIGSAYFTFKEAAKLYVHSHVTTSSLDNFGSICVGGTGPMYSIYSTLVSGVSKHKFIELIPVFITALQGFLETESSDTTPYQHFHTLSTAKTNPLRIITFPNGNLTTFECTPYTKAVYEALKDGAIKFAIQSGTLVPDITDIELALLANKYLKGNHLKYLCIIQDGTFHKVFGNHSTDAGGMILTNFKGKLVEVVIENDNTGSLYYEIFAQNVLRTFYVHIVNIANILYGKYQN